VVGGCHHGRIHHLGHDVVVLGPSGAEDGTGRGVTLVTRGALATVTVRGERRAVAGRHGVEGRRTLAGILEMLAAERAPVAVTTSPQPPLVGELDAVGTDVITLRLGAGRGQAQVALASVVAVVSG